MIVRQGDHQSRDWSALGFPCLNRGSAYPQSLGEFSLREGQPPPNLSTKFRELFEWVLESLFWGLVTPVVGEAF